jgi:hypothetical protein
VRNKRTVLLIFAFLVPIVVLAVFGTYYLQAIGQQRQLKEEVAISKARLILLQTERGLSSESGLESELSDWRSELQKAQDILFQPVNSIAVTDHLFRIAHSSRVTITKIIGTGLTDTTLNELECSNINIDLEAVGELLNVIDFVKRLNNENMTGVVESASIKLEELPESSNSTDGGLMLTDFLNSLFDGDLTIEEELPSVSSDESSDEKEVLSYLVKVNFVIYSFEGE